MIRYLKNESDIITHYLKSDKGKFGIYKCAIPLESAYDKEVMGKSDFLESISPIVQLINYNVRSFGLAYDEVLGLPILKDCYILEYFKDNKVEAIVLHKIRNKFRDTDIRMMSYKETDELLKKINNIWK
jgi:hypothetical protein